MSFKQNNSDTLNIHIKNILENHSKIIKNIDDQISEFDLILKSDLTYFITFLTNSKIHISFWKLFFKVYPKLVQILRELDNMRLKFNIFPPTESIFKVFEQNLDQYKMVLIGQDPYIKKDQAMGLSFSVKPNVTIPPSLWNIFKEIQSEFPERKYKFSNGDLTKWSNNIFLLNSALTVIEGQSNSQLKLWNWFTDYTIKYISKHHDKLVFLLLGKFAQTKSHFIDINKHSIVTGVHPSPISAHNGFFNSDIFKKVESKLGHDFDWSN